MLFPSQEAAKTFLDLDIDIDDNPCFAKVQCNSAGIFLLLTRHFGLLGLGGHVYLIYIVVGIDMARKY